MSENAGNYAEIKRDLDDLYRAITKASGRNDLRAETGIERHWREEAESKAACANHRTSIVQNESNSLHIVDNNGMESVQYPPPPGGACVHDPVGIGWIHHPATWVLIPPTSPEFNNLQAKRILERAAKKRPVRRRRPRSE